MKIPSWDDCKNAEKEGLGLDPLQRFVYEYETIDVEPFRKHLADLIAFVEESTKPSLPIPMVLLCPYCGVKHVDQDEWATKPHRSHECQSCGYVWRPADVATVGVEDIQTRGKSDSTTYQQLLKEG